MSDQDLLPTDNTEKAPNASNENNATDLLAQIKKPDGQQYYRTEADLIAGIQAKDNHLRTLETENAQHRQEVSALQQQLSEMQQQLDSVKDVGAMVEQLKQKQSQTIDTDSIANIARQTIQADAVAQRNANNTALFNAAAIEAFDGDAEKARAHILQAMQAKNLSNQMVEQLRNENPEAALEFLGVQKKQAPTPTQQAPVSYNTNVDLPQEQRQEVKTAEDWDRAIAEGMKQFQ